MASGDSRQVGWSSLVTTDVPCHFGPDKGPGASTVADSVLLTSFFHASVNTQGLGVLPLLVVGVSPVLGGVTGIVGIATFAVVGVVLLRQARPRRRDFVPGP